VRKDDLDRVLRDAGFLPDFTAGSHVTYRHPSGARVTVAAHGAHVPAYIVKQALKAIDRLPTEDDNDKNDEDEKP
jgi:predicted RNA binding protein YcfA (HicA-like mRNA interferase family)